MINPGLAPIPDATLDLAGQAMADFVAEVREQADDLVVGDPVRDEQADRDGRYGFLLTAGDRSVRVLMPGVPPAAVRDMSTSAPCLQVAGEWWWWPSAVVQVVGALR